AHIHTHALIYILSEVRWQSLAESCLLVERAQRFLQLRQRPAFRHLRTVAEDSRPAYSVLVVFSRPYASAAVRRVTHTAALKSLSTHGFPFRRLRRCFLVRIGWYHCGTSWL